MLLLRELLVMAFPKDYGAFAFLQMKVVGDVHSTHTIWNTLLSSTASEM